MSGDSSKPRTIKLFCPSVSKLVPFVALEEQKLDLGSIARVFGLEPSTVKLNGHFISRGVDLVSASVTWRSLLSFFSAKGFSTGTDERDALIVDGKLCKLGTKRSNDSQNGFDGNLQSTGPKDVGFSTWREDFDLQSKKLRQSNSGCDEGGPLVSKWNVFDLKRKQLLEDFNLFKKVKTSGTNSDSREIGNDNGIIPSTALKCSHSSGSMKRMREDEAIAAASCKRIK